jgi:hypothetical protein
MWHQNKALINTNAKLVRTPNSSNSSAVSGGGSCSALISHSSSVSRLQTGAIVRHKAASDVPLASNLRRDRLAPTPSYPSLQLHGTPRSPVRRVCAARRSRIGDQRRHVRRAKELRPLSTRQLTACDPTGLTTLTIPLQPNQGVLLLGTLIRPDGTRALLPARAAGDLFMTVDTDGMPLVLTCN